MAQSVDLSNQAMPDVGCHSSLVGNRKTFPLTGGIYSSFADSIHFFNDLAVLGYQRCRKSQCLRPRNPLSCATVDDIFRAFCIRATQPLALLAKFFDRVVEYGLGFRPYGFLAQLNRQITLE